MLAIFTFLDPMILSLSYKKSFTDGGGQILYRSPEQGWARKFPVEPGT